MTREHDRPDPPTPPTTFHVRAAVAGDPSSLEWLVDRFSPLLHAVAARRLGTRLSAVYDPADVVQDVWTSVLPKLGTLELRGPRTTPTVLKYLTTAVVNHVRKVLEKHLANQLRAAPSGAGVDAVPDRRTGVVTRAVADERARQVHRALDELSEQDREIVILRGLEQQPLKAVADRFGIEPGTAAVRFHRALRRLRHELPDSLFVDLDEAADD